ncbi:MAG: PilT/PilU family type 4a pilus ATPase [Myxococcota bacterium]|nr:PilT/PilU family type 4a pilus ATPase [Myxococcota bacterium]
MDIARVCNAALSSGASDIHIKVGQPPLFRVDGRITRPSGAPELSAEDVGKMAWQLMSPAQREEFKVSPDIDTSYQARGGRFRVNIYRARGQIGMALRAIPAQVKTVAQLGLPRVLQTMAEKQNGLLLVTGATGSGKSTTLAAMVEHINRTRPCHILTIEDPIEFTYKPRKAVLTQREVGTDSASFSRALRGALRQDPDVILLGELRDQETMEIALSAAETGHLVLSTLHTVNAAEAIERIVGFFEPHHQAQIRRIVAGVLVGIVSQRLLPRKGKGRLAAVEILRNVGAINECIGDAARVRELPDLIVKGSAQYATQSFDQSIFWAYQRGQIELDQALRYAHNPDELQLRLQGMASTEWIEPDLATSDSGA